MSWRFLTSHGRVLLCLGSNPGLRIRDLALILGITERSTQKIVGDLVAAGYVTRNRVGRRNEYEIHLDMPLPLGQEFSVRQMLETFGLDEDHARTGSHSRPDGGAQAPVPLAS